MMTVMRQPSDTIEVTSPWDGQLVGEVDVAAPEQVGAAVAAAQAALAAPLEQHQRAEVLDRACALLQEQRSTFAHAIVAEAGKPITLAEIEVDRAVDTLRYCAIEARTLAGAVVPMAGTAVGSRRLALTVRVPVGVVAAITPFNFPLNLCCHKVGPAIAAGCPVVHKPASATPLTAGLLRELLLAAGLPEERYQLVYGGGADTGTALVADPRVAHVSFTGSSEVGWAIRARAPRASVGLELGNSTPLVVFADADLSAAADAVVRGGFGYAGQSCISVQRVLVERSVYPQLTDLVVAGTQQVGVGDPARADVTCGPLIDVVSRDRVLGLVAAAVRAGARRLIGGDHDGNVIEPTVLADVDHGLDISRNEVFGPVVVLTPFDSDDEAVALANGTRYGLQAAVWTRDLTRALRMASTLEFGGVLVNESPTFRADQQPYGGVKDSGTTREGPAWAVREMTSERLVVIRS